MALVTVDGGYTEVRVGDIEVEVELDDFDTDDLIIELESRGQTIVTKEDVQILYDLYTAHNKEQFDVVMKQFFYDNLGRVA